MFDKFKEWHKGLNAEQKDNFYTLLGLLAVAVIFVLAIVMGVISDKEDGQLPDEPVSCEAACSDNPGDGVTVEFPIIYTDTVRAVAVFSGTTFNNSSYFKEIQFTHDIYFYYKERSGSLRHYSYNDPVYVDVDDECSVVVKFDGEEETVFFLENLTKKRKMTEDEAYWDEYLEDRD